MKLCDYCIIFFALFICVMLGDSLRSMELSERFVNKQIAERQMDTLSESALMDIAVRETQGELITDNKKLWENYERAFRAAYDLPVDESLTGAGAEVLSARAYEKKWELEETGDYSESELVREDISDKGIETETGMLRANIPAGGSRWTQAVYGHQFITVFAPRDATKLNRNYTGANISGARIEKKRERRQK